MTGHDWIGTFVVKVFDKKPFRGIVTQWASPTCDEPNALWHVQYEDGDKEDLDESEVVVGIETAKQSVPCS